MADKATKLLKAYSIKNPRATLCLPPAHVTVRVFATFDEMAEKLKKPKEENGVPIVARGSMHANMVYLVAVRKEKLSADLLHEIGHFVWQCDIPKTLEEYRKNEVHAEDFAQFVLKEKE